MPTITIQGTVIDFPDSGTSPNWAPAVIQFAQSVELALSSVVGSFDIPPQTQSIDSSNPASNVDITALTFPVSDVRGAFIRYDVIRETSSTTGVETGLIILSYNPDGAVSSKWEITREYAGSGADITFSVTDAGQVQYTTETLPGTGHTGTISFVAQALLTE